MGSYKELLLGGMEYIYVESEREVFGLEGRTIVGRGGSGGIHGVVEELQDFPCGKSRDFKGSELA